MTGRQQEQKKDELLDIFSDSRHIAQALSLKEEKLSQQANMLIT